MSVPWHCCAKINIRLDTRETKHFTNEFRMLARRHHNGLNVYTLLKRKNERQ